MKELPIKNKTKGTSISKRYKFCLSVLSRARGQMFRRKAKPMIFVFDRADIVPLHMWFVFFPIDVLFLDEERKVVEMKKGFMPFSSYKPKKKALYIIELPAGTIAKSKTKKGDEIVF